MTAPIDTVRAGRWSVDVLYMDNHVLGVVKPRNMLAQGDSTGEIDLLTAMKAYVGEVCHKPGKVYLGLVHRLDRPVGGVMVLARTSKAAARLSAEVAAHRMEKRYLCVVRGDMPGPMALSDWLVKDERSGMVRVCGPDTPGAKDARLTTAPIARREGLTLCEVRLETGRQHQIRVQHQHAGYPLWGDARYGGGRPGEQIALWAWRLTVTHPTLKQPLTLTARPPQDGVWALFQSDWEALYGTP